MPRLVLKWKLMRRNDFLRLLTLAGAGLATPSFAQNGPSTIEGESEVNPHFINSGPGFGNRLALTFDDGPTPGVTERCGSAKASFVGRCGADEGGQVCRGQL